MRSIFRMPSSDLAGDAKRRVPIPRRRKANAQHFWMPSSDLAGSAKRGVPIPRRRKANVGSIV